MGKHLLYDYEMGTSGLDMLQKNHHTIFIASTAFTVLTVGSDVW